MLSFWLLLFAATAAATPLDFREAKTRARVTASCPRERSFCAASLTRATRLDERVPNSSGVAVESSSSAAVPFLTFHRHPLLRDFDDFLDAMVIAPPPPCPFSPRSTHLRGSVLVYSSRSSSSRTGVIYSSGWYVLPPPPTFPMEALPSTTNVMVARRRLQEIVPGAVPVQEVSDEEMQCLQQYIMEHREMSASDCVDAVLEWQSLQPKQGDVSSGPSAVTTPVTAANAPSSSFGAFFVERPFLVFAANMLFLLALCIVLLLLYVYNLEEEDDDKEETTEYTTKPSFHPLRTVLSVPNNDDDDDFKVVYMGVPLQIV